MKTFRTIIAVAISLFMVVYMLIGSLLFAVDLSFDEKNVQKALERSDSLSALLQSAEISLNGEEFKGETANLSTLYSQPEAAALFADIFTGTARYILYNEEYSQINEELVRDYLYAVAKNTAKKTLSEDELEDYASVKLSASVDQFNSYIKGMSEEFLRDEELVGFMRFFFIDLKFICIAGAVVHMLILILLIKGKLGYFLNAAVFGISGISMLLISASLSRITSSIIPSGYSDVVCEMFSEKFTLVGVILFAFFSVLMAIALILFMRKNAYNETPAA